MSDLILGQAVKLSDMPDGARRGLESLLRHARNQHRDNLKPLVDALNALVGNADKEAAHVEADKLLLDFIDDADVRAAFEKIGVWHA